MSFMDGGGVVDLCSSYRLKQSCRQSLDILFWLNFEDHQHFVLKVQVLRFEYQITDI